MTPTFSVIIPAWNAAKYVAETLRGLDAQTFRDFEAILINDGSPDTPELLQAIEPWRDRIQYIAQENAGVACARNSGLRVATGEFLAFLDSDDIWEPQYLAVQLRMLSETGADVVYGDGILFGNPAVEGRRLSEWLPSVGDVSVSSLVSQKCVVFLAATVARRATVDTVGGFDPGLRTAEDLDLWLRILQAGGTIRYHRDPIMRYRRHPGSLTADEVGLAEGVLGAMRKLLRTPLSEDDRIVAEARLQRALGDIAWVKGESALNRGDFDEAVRQWSEANAVRRSRKLALGIALLRISPWLFQLVRKAQARS